MSRHGMSPGDLRRVYRQNPIPSNTQYVWVWLADGREPTVPVGGYRWQDTYCYKKPVVLPKRTVIQAEFVWDNSTDHPRTPFNPPKRIQNGPMSQDEMSCLILGGMPVKASDEGVHWLAVFGHYLEVEWRDKEAKKKGK